LIHQTAIVSENAKIGSGVNIGPYSVIGDDVELEDNVEIMSHVCIGGCTTVGERTKIFPFATIGYQPQDLKYKGEKSRLIIGKNNSIREYVTMHPGTQDGAMLTSVGEGCLFMVGVHIAHDCVIGNNVVMGNNATLGGHVEIADDVIIGGLSAVHQYTRIGKGAIIGGMSGVERDVIPYANVKGERAHLAGLNMIGLKRANVDKGVIFTLKKAYELIFSSSDVLSNNLERTEKSFKDVPMIRDIVDFMRHKSDRSYCQPINRHCR
jgi:UDP-N-acetylglucosamine acyltransferase